MADQIEEGPADVNDDAMAAESGGGGGSKKLLIIAIIAGVLVLGGGVGGFFALSGGDGDVGKEVATEVSTEEGTKEAAEPESDKHQSQGSDAGANASEGGDGKEKSAEGTAKDKDVDIGIDFGETYQMKTFSLNLGNALENRFVRLEVTLEYSGGNSQKREIMKRLPQLRDAVISVVSRKTREFLLAPDGKDTLRKEVLIRINRYMKTKIDAVYITDILIE